jgi:hypothetical protein
MGIRFRRRAQAVYVPFEEKVAERREKQARSYADGGGSRDHSGDPIVRSDLLPPGSFRRMEIERSSTRRSKREEQAGTRSRRAGKISVHEKKVAQETGVLKFSISSLPQCWSPSSTNPTHLLKFAQAFQRMNSNVRILITESDFTDQAVY